MKRYVFIFIFALPFILPGVSFCRQEKEKCTKLTLPVFLHATAVSNIGYLAEKFNLSIAEANIRASEVFNDPQFSFGYTRTQNTPEKIYNASLSYLVNFANARASEIRLAKTEAELSELSLRQYLLSLKCDAAEAYFATLKEFQMYELQKETYSRMEELAKSDSLKYKLGEGSETDALQSLLQAKAQLIQVNSQGNTLENSYRSICLFMGRQQNDSICFSLEDFRLDDTFPDAGSLLQYAKNSRPDLMAAKCSREISVNSLELLKASRGFEVEFQAGYSYTPAANDAVSPVGLSKQINIGATIPLKFSDLNSGAVDAARLQISQSDIRTKQLQLQIEKEVSSAYSSFLAQRQQIELFKQGIIDKAGEILGKKIFSYQHGETGLLDVITARQTYTDLKKSFIQALYDYKVSVIELERTIGREISLQ